MALSSKEAIPLEGSVFDLPLLDALAADLHTCRKERNLPLAKHAHFHILRNGLETNQSLGNFIVPMFVECGSMLDAQKVFVKLLKPNEHSWTSLIQGCVQYGEHQNALSLFEQMQQDCVAPSGYTYLALLKACGQMKSAKEGRAFHLDIMKHGFEEEPFVIDYIVDMYAKCGSFAEAWITVNGLADQEVRLWTTLIVRYVEHGLHEEALNCLTEMQQQGVSPNDVALVCSLKACTALGYIQRGQVIHMHIIQKGLDEDIYIGNTLVDFYVNSGLLIEARVVFDGLSSRDVVSWTALISGYAEQGFGQEALSCFESMLLEGMVPNFVTYFSSLKACVLTRAIDKGRALHIATTKEGFEQEYLVSSTLIDLYSKCGLPVEARSVFDLMPARNVVMWTALMTGYAEHGLATEALNCWTEMQGDGISADAATFVCVLKVCGSLGSIEHGFQLHLDAVIESYSQNSYVGSTLVDMYARCGCLTEARAALEEMPVHSVVAWTSLMDGYTEHGFRKEALACYGEMQSAGLSPNAHTFVCSLKASMAIDSICEGENLHMSIVKLGTEKDLFVGSTLVDMYSKCGFLDEAQYTFEGLPARNTIVWNSAIIGCVACKDFQQAWSYLRQMQVEGVYSNTMTWNALLMGLSEHEEVARSFKYYMQMLDQRVTPDSLTFVSILKTCGNAAALQTGRYFHAHVENLNGCDVGEAGEVIIATSLIDMYSKCGCMRDAQLVFDNMSRRDLLAWATLIAGYARQGDCECIFGLLKVLGNEGLKPDEFISFNVLTACSHAGQVMKGTTFFEGMSVKYGTHPTVTHENCVIDLLCRAGQVVEAVTVLKEMPFHPDSVTWNTVLAACHCCAEIDISQRAFEHVALLDDNDGWCKLACVFQWMRNTKYSHHWLAR
ncbi:hypothetical protein L7F22_048226 [Adiantum nelumboides]|nr:hypothetical protein [Adiantum nelumboides]